MLIKEDDDEILAKSNIDSSKKTDQTAAAYEDLAMKRRLTIADNEIEYDDDDMEQEYDEDGDYEGEEIDYDDEEYDEEDPEENIDDVVPKTFEQFSTLYKQPIVKDEPKIAPPQTYDSPKVTTPIKEPTIVPLIKPIVKATIQKPLAVEKPKVVTPILQTPILPTPILPRPILPTPILPTPILPTPIPSIPIQSSRSSTGAISKVITTHQAPVAAIPTAVTIPYEKVEVIDDEDIEYDYDDDEEEYEDEEERYSDEGEEVDDEEEISDVDDSDLLKRLDAKYGKLPDGDGKDGDHGSGGGGDDSWTSKS